MVCAAIIHVEGSLFYDAARRKDAPLINSGKFKILIRNRIYLGTADDVPPEVEEDPRYLTAEQVKALIAEATRPPKGDKGDPGASAYEIAVAGGYEGTETEWLASLKGEPGKSAYEVAVAGGYDGTESEWLASLIGETGEQLGLMSARDALKKAEEKNLDLVKIAPTAKPPVCKIMDYGKYRFEKAKRDKEARKNQKTVELKEIRLSLNIDTHDFETKAKHAEKFLKAGNKVKVSIRFRGREMAHPEMGHRSMEKFAEACKDFSTVEKPSKMEGRQMLMFLAPLK